MSEIQRRLITYCTNVHAGETWQETFAALENHIPKVKEAVSPDHPFPIGLRLSALAARELAAGHSHSFGSWLREHDCFVPTINGFPFGAFHAARVKEKVYHPDWRSRERASYTKRLATLLAEWLPENQAGSISSVPIGFQAHHAGEDHLVSRGNLLHVMEHLDRLRQEKGADIVLSLEPEPACVLESTADLVRFLEWMDFPESLRDRIGICLDCCHLALQFEEPAEVVSLLTQAGVRIGKVQASSALRQRHDRREALIPFQEQCYLHQVVVRGEGGLLTRYDDLPDALKRHQGKGEDEWRCHFHVPIFLERAGEYETTGFFVERLLPLLDRQVLLEVETYTWDVLPPELRLGELTHSIIREIRWLQEKANVADRQAAERQAAEDKAMAESLAAADIAETPVAGEVGAAEP